MTGDFRPLVSSYVEEVLGPDPAGPFRLLSLPSVRLGWVE